MDPDAHEVVVDSADLSEGIAFPVLAEAAVDHSRAGRLRVAFVWLRSIAAHW
ncbi:hypothetical protein ACQEUR_18070 [Plantactinospora sp. CA-290183]